MFSMSCLTTLKLTSASRSAMRISRRAVSMFSAESFPSPRRFLKTRCSLSDKLSNIGTQGSGTQRLPETHQTILHYTEQQGRMVGGDVEASMPGWEVGSGYCSQPFC